MPKITVSESLYKLAEVEGKMNNLSAETQIESWAQAGRILLQSSELSSGILSALNDGKATIEDIPEDHQTAVAKDFLEQAIMSPNSDALKERAKKNRSTVYSIEEDGIIQSNEPE